ncbi:MAG: argininosuccinate lyase, partial [Clostridium sp.]|nr:argininosuccinate lyase [Clostridium sp.]
SFAATGWAEEDGTWVYYDRNGDKVTDKWAKSGNNWYYLDSDGEMAVDSLIEDGDNYYYVDVDGVMAANQWVAIDNEDAGQDDEPEHYWYYFQANGKALKQGDGSTLSLKTVNGKKYAFDDEGKMLYGWVAADNAERIDDADGDAFKDGDYYFGGEDDGAMTTGWLLMDITYDEATSDYEIAPAFNEDEDQSRWFYFKSNGKKVKAENGDVQKSKTINGKKYEFDENGAMTAEWSLDVEKASKAGVRDSYSTATTNSNAKTAQYSKLWRYFNSVEDGSRVSKGWFKVVAAEYMNYNKNNDDEDAWYYADGSGNLYAGEFKTIKGKKYAFRQDGRMISGLQFIKKDANGNITDVKGDDDNYNFDTEDDFIKNATGFYAQNGYDCYYFGGGEDGAMKTNKTNITIDGDSFNFYFEKSGSKKGAGLTGEKDDKYYLAGMLVKAGSDEKYQVVQKKTVGNKTVYVKLDDAKAFLAAVAHTTPTADASGKITIGDVTKKAEDLKEAYTVTTPTDSYFLVNTSGSVIDKKSKSKDGDDYVFVTVKGGKILGVYVED